MPSSGPSQQSPLSAGRHRAPPRSLLIALLVALLIHVFLIFGMHIDGLRSGYTARKTISITLARPGPATVSEAPAMATSEPTPPPAEVVDLPEHPLPKQPPPAPKPVTSKVPAPEVQSRPETQLSFVGPPTPDVSVKKSQEQPASKAPDQKLRQTPGSSVPRDANDEDISDEEMELADALEMMEDDDEDEDEDEPEDFVGEGEADDGDEDSETSFAGQTLLRPHSAPPPAATPSAAKPVVKTETRAGSSPSGAVGAPDAALAQRHVVPAPSSPTNKVMPGDISRPTNVPSQAESVTDSSAAPESSPGKSLDARDRGKRKGTASSSSKNAGESDITRKPGFSASLLSQQIAEVSADIYRQRSDEMRGRKIVYATEVKNHRLVVAAYEQAWQEKVERIGNLNYPDEARRDKLSGTLTLAVGIKPDGSVYSVQIQKPSGHEALDNAAHNIVRLAAPFAPLPREISDEVDILVITRTWRFDSNYHLETRDR